MERYGIYRDKIRKPYPESNTTCAGAHAQNCQCAKCKVKRDRRNYVR